MQMQMEMQFHASKSNYGMNNINNVATDQYCYYQPMQKLQRQPPPPPLQLPVQGKRLRTSSTTHTSTSTSGYPSLKKRRICGNFVPNPNANANANHQWVPFPNYPMMKAASTGRNVPVGSTCTAGGEMGCKGKGYGVGGLSLTSVAVGGGGEGEGNLKPDQLLWKTKLCRNWTLRGVCSYGKVCRFAHGQSELRNLSGHCAVESWVVPACSLKNIVYKDRNGNGNGNCFKQPLPDSKALERKQAMKLCGIYADWIEDMTTLTTPSYK